MTRLANTIRRKKTGTYTVTRPAGELVNGRWVEGEGTTFEIVAAVSPASPDQLQRLPEGHRSQEVLAVYTDSELRKDDVIDRDGTPYQVEAVEWWQAGGFWKALARRATP